MSASPYLDLDDLELAQAVEAGDPDARLEVRRRYLPVAIILAKRICARIGHRGGRCPGLGCEQAFTWIMLDLLDRFAGHDAAPGRRARRALIVTWLAGASHRDGFAGYVLGPGGDGRRGMLTEGRRAWNKARGLRVRANPCRDLEICGEAGYRDLVAEPALAGTAQLLGLEQPAAIWAWLEVLFVDACETGLEDPIDARRVARFLLGADPSEEAVRAVERLARAVDRLLATRWPDWYDEHLSRPRQHTRRTLPLEEVR